MPHPHTPLRYTPRQPTRAPVLHPLEPRRLFAITWANRGADNFDTAYGDNAALARSLVDNALADWSAVLSSSAPIKQNIKLKISATDLEPNRYDSSTLGFAQTTRITLDLNAAEGGWYFDTDLSDTSDFAVRRGLFAASAFSDPESKTGPYDFYTVAAHEIGHALGFRDRANPYHFETASGKIRSDANHTKDPNDLMHAILPAMTRRHVNALDASLTTLGRKYNPDAFAPARSFSELSASSNQPYVKLTWTVPDDAANVILYRAEGNLTNTDHLAANAIRLHEQSGDSRAREFTDTTAEPGHTYTYFLQTVDANRYESRGSKISAERLAVGYAKPLAETASASFTASQDNRVVGFSFTNLPVPATYRIYRSLNGGPRELITPTPFNPYNYASDSPILDHSLAIGQSAEYFLTAEILGREYDYAGPVTGKAVSVKQQPVLSRGYDISLSWNTVPNSTYTVYRTLENNGTLESSGPKTALSFSTQTSPPGITRTSQQFYYPNTQYDPIANGAYYWVVWSFGNKLTETSEPVAVPFGPFSSSINHETGPNFRVKALNVTNTPETWTLIDHFEIYRSLSGNFDEPDTEFLGSYAPENLRFTDPNAPRDKLVYYQLRFINKPFEDQPLTATIDRPSLFWV